MQNARPDPVCSPYLDGRYTMAEIAAEFGVNYSTVSRAVAKCKT
nr:helix-turn-helix domain-containing protein [Pseudoalteromonas phenolica]